MKRAAVVIFVFVFFSSCYTNAFSKCKGVPDSCSSLFDDAQCRSHNGCSSSSNLDKFIGCNGRATACNQISDPINCFCQSGCYWENESPSSASCSPCNDDMRNIRHGIGEMWSEPVSGTPDINFYRCVEDNEGHSCRELLYKSNLQNREPLYHSSNPRKNDEVPFKS